MNSLPEIVRICIYIVVIGMAASILLSLLGFLLAACGLLKGWNSFKRRH